MIHSLVTNLTELKKVCQEVSKDEDVSEIVTTLSDTLTHLKHGYALAANQVGIQKRIFYARFPKKDGGVTEMVFINPKIIEKEEKFINRQEGCLSFPGLRIDTDRYIYIGVAYFDEKFEQKTIMAQDLEAIIIQHECDHINGMTIFSRKHKAK